MAPFIVRRPLFLVVALAIGSLALRAAAYSAGLSSDPWSYRFFPFELALFFAGSVSYHIYRSLRDAKLERTAIVFGWSAVAIVLAYPLLESGSRTFFDPARICVLAYLMIALPVLFKHTNRLTVDRVAGDLSYPVYLCHMIFIELLQGVPQLASHPHVRTAGAVAGALGLSAAIAVWIESPIDRYRQKRVKAQNVAAGQ